MSKRFPTNKRFGLEGLEAEVPMWEAILADAAAGGATDVVIAPMHRGRLTLITRVVGKPFNAAFAELMGTPQVPDGIAASSDVPYNLEIGRAHVRTTVTNAQLVCRLLLEKKTNHNR